MRRLTDCRLSSSLNASDFVKYRFARMDPNDCTFGPDVCYHCNYSAASSPSSTLNRSLCRNRVKQAVGKGIKRFSFPCQVRGDLTYRLFVETRFGLPVRCRIVQRDAGQRDHQTHTRFERRGKNGKDDEKETDEEKDDGQSSRYSDRSLHVWSLVSQPQQS